MRDHASEQRRAGAGRPPQIPDNLARHLLRRGLLWTGALLLLINTAACTAGGVGPAAPSSGLAGPVTQPTTPPGAMVGPPRLIFAEYSHDFGQISSKGPEVAYRFVFTNNGSSPLRIDPVTLEPGPGGFCTCGVTATAPAATIAPGSAGAIAVAISKPMPGMPGVFLRIASNDPVEPEQTITMTFQSVP